jgi:4-hydroxy-2-oxoheptanedioate aldolase
MKQKLAAGRPALGCSVMIPSPQIVEMLGHAGFDWVLIDLEHGTIGPESAELMCMAAEAAGITAIARPRSNAAADIASVLDRGALGVQVPHVNTAEDARRAVAAARFGSGDRRGLAAGTRPDRYGLGARMADYVERANAEILVCVQLEHQAALANVDEILAVDGVDVFFIGPSDLSQSMGHPGNAAAQPVADAIAMLRGKITAANKCLGMPSGTPDVAAAVSNGVRYIYTHLPRVLGAGATGFLKAARGG